MTQREAWFCALGSSASFCLDNLMTDRPLLALTQAALAAFFASKLWVFRER